MHPTRLRHPWDSPSKNTGAGCHFLLQCMKVKSENEVAQSCPTLSDAMDCSAPGSSIHEIFQAGVLEWGAIALTLIQFSHSVVTNSSRPHGPQHTRPRCSSPTPRVYSNSYPLRQWCHPTNSSSVVPFLLPPSIFPSIWVFPNESVLRIRWPKYWSFSFIISPSDEYSGLISFRMDWLDLLVVQGTLKSLLQHHSSKASFKGYHMDFLIHSRSICQP